MSLMVAQEVLAMRMLEILKDKLDNAIERNGLRNLYPKLYLLRCICENFSTMRFRPPRKGKYIRYL
jgi:hypothetical protein